MVLVEKLFQYSVRAAFRCNVAIIRRARERLFCYRNTL